MHSDFRLVPSNVYSNRRRLDSGVDQRAGNPANDKPFAATAWFVGGYLLAWIAFSLAATTAQWALERPGLAHAPPGRWRSVHGTESTASAVCWALMVLLFVGGVNLFWIGRACVFVLVEKVIPLGRINSRVAGVIFIAWGGWLLLQHP